MTILSDPRYAAHRSGYFLVCLPVNLGRDRHLPRARRRGDPSDGARVHAGTAGAASPAPSAMNDVTRILSAIEHGDPQAAEQLLPLVYDELRKLAAQRLAQEKPGQTLQATALVHEAYLRLVDVDQAQRWDSRGHFFAAAAEAMRRILVENARRKKRLKAGRRPPARRPRPGRSESRTRRRRLLALDEALETLNREDPQAAELVKLRFFAGLSVTEAAGVLGISAQTPMSTGPTPEPGSAVWCRMMRQPDPLFGKSSRPSWTK